MPAPAAGDWLLAPEDLGLAQQAGRVLAMDVGADQAAGPQGALVADPIGLGLGRPGAQGQRVVGVGGGRVANLDHFLRSDFGGWIARPL